MSRELYYGLIADLPLPLELRRCHGDMSSKRIALLPSSDYNFAGSRNIQCVEEVML